jgi:O-antigen/teichoic acid export membrane protein
MSEESAGRDGGSQSSVTVAAASALLQFTALGVFAVLSHALPREELAAFRQVLLIQGAVSILCALGTPTALLYSVGRSNSGQDRHTAYVTTLLWMLIATLLCGALTGITVVAASGALHSAALRDSSLLAGVGAALGIHSLFIGPVLISARAVRRYLAYSVAYVCLLSFLTWLFVNRSPNLNSALTAAAIAAAGGWVATAVILFVNGSNASAREAARSLPGAIRYGGPIAASSALYSVAYQADHLVATSLLGQASYALYAAGAWQLPVGPLVQRAQADILLPILSEHHANERTEEFWLEWRRLVVPWTAMGAVLFWGLFPVSTDVTRVLLGPAFDASAVVLQVYALLLPLRMTAIAVPLRAAGVTWLDMVASIGFAVVSLGVGALVTPTLGLAGPAVGMTAGYVAWLGVNVEATRRMLDARLSDIIPIRAILSGFIVVGLAALPARLVSHSLFGPGAKRLACYVVLYGAVVFMMYAGWRRGRGRPLQRSPDWLRN